jgi:hypothetical protein
LANLCFGRAQISPRPRSDLTKRARPLERATPFASPTLLFVSTDGLQGAGDDASVSNDAHDENDGALADGAAVADAGSDAPAGPFCPSHPGHTLCADFDENSATVGWSTTDVFAGGFNLDVDASLSPPASLATNNPATDTTDHAEARLVENIALPNPAHVHVEFDVDLCDLTALTAAGYIELVKIGFSPGFSDSGIELQIKASGIVVTTDNNGAIYTGENSIEPGVWTHVALDIVDGTNGSIHLQLGDPNVVGPAIALTNVDTSTDVDGSTYSAVVVGLYSADAPICTTLFDNVLIDVN